MESNSGKGGGMYYSCKNTEKCRLTMNGNHTFKGNKAENAGGAIHWDMLEPIFETDI